MKPHLPKVPAPLTPKRRRPDGASADRAASATTGMAKGASGDHDRVRQCALTRVHRPVDELIRFVLDPNGAIVPDLKHRLPGRGVWLTCARDVVEAAVEKNQFARALRQPVEVSSDLVRLLDRLLAEAALGLLSLANKAGEVVTGFSKVEELVTRRRETLACLLHAVEAAENGRQKLDAKVLKVAEFVGMEPKILRCFTTDELSLALGRLNVVHAAVIQGRVSPKFLQAAARLENFRAGSAAFAAA